MWNLPKKTQYNMAIFRQTPSFCLIPHFLARIFKFFHLYCWDHVSKVNEWCLIDCFLYKWYAITVSQNTKSFPPTTAF